MATDLSVENSGAKVAIVTGGSRGIGRATVLSLAEDGVRCIFTYRSNRTEADAVATLCAAKGAPAIALPLDVSDARGFDAFVAEVDKALDQIGVTQVDYLINNAGTSSSASLMSGDEAELDAQFNVHFKAVFLLTQKLAPRIRDGGRIVNVSSGLARFTMPNRAIYGPMKAAVEALTRYMALELGPRRIAVNVVAPGAIATDFSGGLVRDNPEVNQMIASHTALGRVGLPEDVGAVIAGLVSNRFGWVNAQRIEVSGGVNF